MVGQARAAVDRFVASHDVEDVTSSNVRLCVSEAVTNAVIHASAQGGVDASVSYPSGRTQERQDGEDLLIILT